MKVVAGSKSGLLTDFLVDQKKVGTRLVNRPVSNKQAFILEICCYQTGYHGGNKEMKLSCLLGSKFLLGMLLESKVFQKQPPYLYSVGLRSLYVLFPLGLTCGITLNMLFYCCSFSYACKVLTILYMSISMMTHYLDESFLRIDELPLFIERKELEEMLIGLKSSSTYFMNF